MAQATISTPDCKSLVVLSSLPFVVGPKQISTLDREVERIVYRVRRPRGKKVGIVIRYESGTFSTVTWL